MTEDEKIDTFNKFGVGVSGDSYVILIPPQRMSKKDALLLAGWLATLADPEGLEFQKVLKAIRE